MKNEQKGIVALWVLLALIVVPIFLFVAGLWMNAAYGNKTEARIEAVWEQNSNVYSTMASSVAEIANVAEESVLQQRQYIEQALGARYGDDGSQALFQWLQEQNPNLDISVYKRLGDVIEAKRIEFQQSQAILVDVKRQYVTALGNPMQGVFLSMSGYPKINVGYPRGSQDDYAVVISDKARTTFETGVDDGIAPFGSSKSEDD